MTRPCGFGSADPSADAWSHRNNVRHLQKNLKAIGKKAAPTRTRGGNGKRKRGRSRRSRGKVAGQSLNEPSGILPSLACAVKEHPGGSRSQGGSGLKAGRRNKNTSNLPSNPLAAESMRVTQYEKHLRKVSVCVRCSCYPYVHVFSLIAQAKVLAHNRNIDLLLRYNVEQMDNHMGVTTSSGRKDSKGQPLVRPAAAAIRLVEIFTFLLLLLHNERRHHRYNKCIVPSLLCGTSNQQNINLKHNHIYKTHPCSIILSCLGGEINNNDSTSFAFFSIFFLLLFLYTVY